MRGDDVKPILFRGKAINRDSDREYRTNYKNGDWVYGLVSRLYDERFENLPAEMTNEDGVSGIDVDYRTIGEWTGIEVYQKDSVPNDEGVHPLTQLYEGDICELTTFDLNDIDYQHIGIIEFVGGAFWFMERGDEGIAVPLCEIGDIQSDLEILGNIYDNPELLEVVK